MAISNIGSVTAITDSKAAGPGPVRMFYVTDCGPSVYHNRGLPDGLVGRLLFMSECPLR